MPPLAPSPAPGFSDLDQQDVNSLFHPYTNLERHRETGPMVITHGKGVRVFDEQGKDYIEGMAGLWCTSLGWGEERLANVAAEQIRKLAFYHPFSSKSHEPAILLAERLLRLTQKSLAPNGGPAPFSKVFFTNSGSEANDTAIKLIWYYNNARGKPAKKKMISRIKAYHGVTIASASLTILPVNQRGFDLPLPGFIAADCPHYYRFALPGESEEEFSTRLADNLEAQILSEGPETIAAFFAEPVMGAGGVMPPPQGYFEKIQPILRKYDILLVADEVICGFGRTANMFGSETYHLTPDLMTIAKGLSSGYLPIAGLLVSDAIYQTVSQRSAELGVFGHGFTYGGHPVSAAVALETLKIYEERDILSHVRAISPVLQNGLRGLAQHPLVGEARGVGLIGAIELVQDQDSRTAFDPKLAAAAKLVALAQEEGVILRAMGDSVAFSPPLVITEDELQEMLTRFRRALERFTNWTRDHL